MSEEQNTLNFDLQKDIGNASADEILNNPNSITIDLSDNQIDTTIADNGSYTQPSTQAGGAGNGSSSPYTAPSVKLKPLPAILTTQSVICFDSECTGINPWDDQLLGLGFWDLKEDKSQMVQFFGWDEKEIVSQAVEWLNSKDVAFFVGYNQAYDQRHLLTRCMIYQLQCPCLFTAGIIDLMDILKKGTIQSLYSNQATGSVETWETYFWNDKKPYTIEQCFEGVRNKDLSRLQLRNRSCVTGEGDLFLLMRWVSGSGYTTQAIPHPTVETRDQELSYGITEVQCPKCLYLQPFDLNLDAIHCVICDTLIPNPKPEEYLHDIVRPLDYKSVGLQTATTTKAKTTKKATHKAVAPAPTSDQSA